jgi:hypothetical protein
MNDISKRFLWVSVYAVAMTLLEAVAGGRTLSLWVVCFWNVGHLVLRVVESVD